MRKQRHLLSYLAGIFDGEGCVSIYKMKPRGRGVNVKHRVTLQVTMVEKPIPLLFQNLFGGHLYARKGRPLGARNCWQWGIGDTQALEMLKLLLPYSIVKRPQMEVAIHLLEHVASRKVRGKLLTEEELALREADRILCSNMKKEWTL